MKKLTIGIKKYALVWIWPVILSTSYSNLSIGSNSSTLDDTVTILKAHQPQSDIQSAPYNNAAENEQMGSLKNTGTNDKEAGSTSIIECMVDGITLPLLEWGIQYIYN